MCLAVGQWNFICKNKEEAGFGLCSYSLLTPALNSNCQLIRHFHLQIPQVPQNSMFQGLTHSLLSSGAAKSLQSCPTLFRPHRRQPTRLPCSWDSPGKNTGVGCHCLLQCMKVKSESEVTQSCPTLSDTAAHQASPSMGLSRQEYWSGVPLNVKCIKTVNMG